MIRGAVLDWSGSMVDKYSMGPARGFVNTFAKVRLPLTMAQARAPTGKCKREHITDLLKLPHIQSRYKSDPSKDEKLIDNFVTLYNSEQASLLQTDPTYTKLIPGTRWMQRELKRRFGITKIAVTTGFPRYLADIVKKSAANQGFVPTVDVASDEVSKGRPHPFMIWKAMEMMQLSQPDLVLKVGDTPQDMAEGRNANCWTAGVVDTSNELNINDDKLSRSQLLDRKYDAATKLLKAGAHFVIPNITHIPNLINVINFKIAQKKN